jgi:hypothetical protein
MLSTNFPFSFDRQETQVPPKQWYLELGVSHYVTMPDGSNIRKTLVDKISALQKKLLVSSEDDTKSLGFIITVRLNGLGRS